jgi:hypothetical protein
VLFSLVLGLAADAAAQTAPPVQGTIAPDDTTRHVYAAGHAVIVGVESAFGYVRDLFAGKPPAVDPLGGLREGTTVVVRQESPAGNGGASELDRSRDDRATVTEATVTSIDRMRRDVTIRFDDGKKEKLRLAGSTAKNTNAGRTAEALVAMSYPDDKGARVEHLFTKVN